MLSSISIISLSGRAPGYPGAPPRNPACGFSAPGSSDQHTERAVSRQSDGDMGMCLWVPAVRRCDDTLICRPLPSTGITPLPRYYGPIRLPSALTPGLGIALPWRPRSDGRADGGISRVPCASRPCMPTAEAPVDASPLSPERAAAAAFPAVVYGSASTVKGISGLIPFSPACVAAFGLQDSCLRFARAVTRPDARLGPSGRVAHSLAGGTSRASIDARVTHWEAPTLPGARNVPFPSFHVPFHFHADRVPAPPAGRAAPASLRRQGVRRRPGGAGDPRPRLCAPRAAAGGETLSPTGPAPSRAPVGGRANPRVAESLPQIAHPLREARDQLRCPAGAGMCAHRLSPGHRYSPKGGPCGFRRLTGVNLGPFLA